MNRIASPPLAQGAARCKNFKKNGGPVGGCALDKARLGHHFSFILTINRKQRCKKRRSAGGLRLGQGYHLHISKTRGRPPKTGGSVDQFITPKDKISAFGAKRGKL